MDLKAIKVKIKRGANGRAIYPNFKQLQVLAGFDWAEYVDREGLGWMYDVTSGHDDDDVDSPRGVQFGVLAVSPEFAEEAVAKFPDTCELIDESGLEVFYETKVSVDELPDELDEALLKNIKNELEILRSLSPSSRFPSDNSQVSVRISDLETQVLTMLDPNDSSKGVRKNTRKRWQDLKARRGVTILDPLAVTGKVRAV